MIRKLGTTGNSECLIVDRTLREHLDINGYVEIQLVENAIVLRKPKTVQEVATRAKQRYGKALKKLAE